MWQGREWQRCDDGKGGLDRDDGYDRDEALVYCENLVNGGYSDWQLPTIDELKSLVVCTNGHPVPLDTFSSCDADGYTSSYRSPAIDEQFMCRTDVEYITSSYEIIGGIKDPYVIYFGSGSAGFSWSPNNTAVRCVR